MKKTKNQSKTKTRTTVRTSDIIRDEIKSLYDTDGLSFGKIAALPQFFPIPRGTICSIYHGAEVPEKWKERLGIKREIPKWVIEATNNLAELEEKAAPQQKHIYVYTRDRKRIKVR